MIDDKLSKFWEYRYLKKYYNYHDSMNIHGVSRMEIKHSNFLKWLLTPKNNPDLEDFALRRLLILIQKKAKDNLEYDKFSKLDLESAIYSYEGEIVEREKDNIDLIIKVNIDNIPYIIIIENKIGAALYNNLEKYYQSVKEKNPKAQIIRVFLYYYCDSNGLKKARDNKYITIKYQDIYDKVLKDAFNYSIDSRNRNIIYDYIHCLASFTETKNYYMIITDEEKYCLTKLFAEKEVQDILKYVFNNKNVSSMFDVMLAKYYEISDNNNDNNVNNLVKKIVTGKKYFLDGGPFKNRSFDGIGELLKEMIKGLLANNVSLEVLDKTLNNIYDGPIFVKVDDVDKTKHPGYYTTYNKTFEYNGVTYYVCSSWGSNEYEKLKNEINKNNLGVKLN